MRHPVSFMVLPAVALLATLCGGCSDGNTSGSPTTTTSAVATAVAVSADEAALHHTQLVLPAGATVLGSAHISGEHEMWAVVVEVDDEQVGALLTGSGVRKPLEPGRVVTLPTVPEFPSPQAQHAESTQDTITQAVIREVMVNRVDPERVRVHVWAYPS